MSVLVGGGGGSIGSHLVRKLAERGEDVVILDLSPNMALLRARRANIIELGAVRNEKV